MKCLLDEALESFCLSQEVVFGKDHNLGTSIFRVSGLSERSQASLSSSDSGNRS